MLSLVANPLTIEIQTPLIKDALNKRVHGELSGVETKDEQLFKKQKVLVEKCDIVVIDEEGESNLLDNGVVIEEENYTE